MRLDSLSTFDAVALAIVALAVLRGLWIGVVREAFSLAALAAACLAVRLWLVPAEAWVQAHAPFVSSPLAARVAAGALLAIGALVAVALVGRVVRRGIHAVGLGFLDRLGGGVLGAAEGGLVVALVVVLLVGLLGRGHPAVRESRVAQALSGVERIARGVADLPDVAAPPRRQE
jgi:membrane protein required for colicin V production